MMQLHHATLERPESDADFLPAQLTPSPRDAEAFLRRFAPAGPWVLSAIQEGRRDVPTVTFKPGDEPAMVQWIEKHQATQANIYFLVGEPLTPLARKAKKLDMARSHWLWADLDASRGLDWSDPEAVTAEMTALRARLDGCGLPPTVIVSSGGGLQAFWHLAEPFELAGDAQRIAAFEELNKSLTAALGADHCHNADRIMRLPGTVNFPNAVKRAAGRQPALASLVLNSAGLDYPAEAFSDLAQASSECAALSPAKKPAKVKLPLRLKRRLRTVPADGDRSRAFFGACCALFEHGLSEAEAVAAFEAEPGGAAAKFIERGDLAEEVARIRTKWTPEPSSGDEIEWADLTPKGGVRGRSQRNIRQFLDHVGVSLSYDEMAHRLIITRNDQSGTLTDEVARDLWLEADALGLWSTEAYFTAVIESFARRASFHPMRHYIDRLVWDGKPRLEKWLSHYLGAEDSELNAAYGRKHLIAAVRRLRQPGAKYDTMLILQGPQGKGKSSAIRALCPSEDYFTDNLSAGADQKEIIEVTTGKWLIELAELDGMGKRDASTVKAMLSRQIDGARLAYGRNGTERPRQFVLFGTCNDNQYLRDQTGNRRFWPVTISGQFDADEIVENIARDRDQLWAESAHYEAMGESIALPKPLWAVAAEAQAERLIVDPWQERLGEVLSGRQGDFLRSDEIYDALGVVTERRNPSVSHRIASILQSLGYVRIQRRSGERRVWGYVRR